MRNITERKLAEEALRKAYDEVETRVKERTAELTEINKQLEQEIIERKRVEDSLRESEEKLKAIFNSVGDGIALVDMKGKVISINKRLIEVGGYTEKEIIGKRFKFLKIFPPRSLAKMLTNFSKLISGQEVPTYDVEVYTKAGEKKNVELRGTLLRKGGKVEGIIGVMRDITERKLAEEKIEASLQEKEVLLQEIHHRVKNNLQVVSSLLYLQSRSIKSKQAIKILQESQNRVRSMALIHERLYQSQDLANVDFCEYIQNLASKLYMSYSIDTNAIKLNINADNIFLSIDTAIPCGLIINELISNCLKHAFPNGKKGEIRIELHSNDEGQFTLIVSDNGVGFPKDLDFRRTKSLGMQLVVSLAEQIEGTIEIDKRKGTVFKITFS